MSASAASLRSQIAHHEDLRVRYTRARRPVAAKQQANIIARLQKELATLVRTSSGHGGVTRRTEAGRGGVTRKGKSVFDLFDPAKAKGSGADKKKAIFDPFNLFAKAGPEDTKTAKRIDKMALVQITAANARRLLAHYTALVKKPGLPPAVKAIFLKRLEAAKAAASVGSKTRVDVAPLLKAQKAAYARRDYAQVKRLQDVIDSKTEAADVEAASNVVPFPGSEEEPSAWSPTALPGTAAAKVLPGDTEAVDAEGMPVEAETPWYKSWWAIGLGALVVIGGGYAATRKGKGGARSLGNVFKVTTPRRRTVSFPQVAAK